MKRVNYFIHFLVVSTLLFQANALIAGSAGKALVANSVNSSNSGSTPAKWSETENIKWKTAVHGLGWSTPVVSGDQIWITTATPDGKQMYAVCVNAKTGAIVHDILVLENEKPFWKNAQNSYATPTPVVADGFVYAEFGPYGTACIDAQSGKIVWKRTDISTENIIHGPASSPILYKNLLILHHEATKTRVITALDIKTGATIWQANRPEEVYVGVQDDWHKSHATPIVISVNGKDQLISEGSQICQAFDPETGKEIWRVLYGGHDSTVSSPVFWNGLVYINTGLNSAPVEIWAVRPDGTGDVTSTKVVWKYTDDVPGLSTPVVKDGLIFMVSERGSLSCVDAKTGQQIWKEKLTGNYNGTPVWVGDKIYVTSVNGLTTVIKADQKFEVLSTNQLEGKFIARLVVVDNALILRSDTQIYRIEN